ncbi:flagellar hook-length control protein FliK [Glaciimonas sp. PAMC28666]|uniref:flagellar hook-length control protein FliK n=1 Tax=Glaciimonas sp. PAMC28666 TaxID=2807626 RepID=UPI0019664E4D|nr:flagellar hook-length control protein FliK [Glaciimonas sp. PAMC28666]QRX83153.1 flagellar hook-length control protein FliK [Glaciimonas sp. PAMC28666]
MATTLGQRADLLPLRAQTDVGGPGAAVSTQVIANDPRIPSRQALDLLVGQDANGDVLPSTPSADGATLSIAARVISAILGPTPADVEALQGSVPIWSSTLSPAPDLLAAELASTVITSGLFYEAHLLQFAAGGRTWEQMLQEPQAALGWPAPDDDVAPPVADDAMYPTSIPDTGSDALTSQIPQQPTSAASIVTFINGDAQLVTTAALTTLAISPRNNSGSVSVEAAYRAGSRAPLPTRALDDNSASMSSAIIRADRPLIPTVHPDAAGLVRQQLELLAMPVFRWSGEAWPDARMEWEINERKDAQPEAAVVSGVARIWNTRVAITLPKLGTIELSVSVCGDNVHADMAAGEDASRVALRNESAALRQRFADVGLQLSGLHVVPLAPLRSTDTTE